jgi:hypothetical protein
LWLLTHFSIPGATCIPLNFYDWLLGATIGWSEFMLRLPSLICGLLCVLICPLLARKLIGTRRAVLLGFLLAISPTLIFYSRISRPYSAVALLAFAAVLFAARWMQSGGFRSVLFFICFLRLETFSENAARGNKFAIAATMDFRGVGDDWNFRCFGFAGAGSFAAKHVLHHRDEGDVQPAIFAGCGAVDQRHGTTGSCDFILGCPRRGRD